MPPFLSTLSLRRATLRPQNGKKQHNNFYPRSPCGERLALYTVIFRSLPFLSTLSLRRATSPQVADYIALSISIHALLAESDSAVWLYWHLLVYFYPRSPCGERRLHYSDLSRFWHDFYPRSPCGERRLPTALRTPHHRFLSTLSLRRATFQAEDISTRREDFYPRSPCGERRLFYVI